MSMWLSKQYRTRFAFKLHDPGGVIWSHGAKVTRWVIVNVKLISADSASPKKYAQENINAVPGIYKKLQTNQVWCLEQTNTQTGRQT